MNGQFDDEKKNIQAAHVTPAPSWISRNKWVIWVIVIIIVLLILYFWYKSKAKVDPGTTPGGFNLVKNRG